MDDARTALIRSMFAALAEGRSLFHDGRRFNGEEMRECLREWIPTEIIVMRVCQPGQGAVVAAPHVSFDNWTQYFANRVAADLDCGEVIARNFRDDDGGTIPVSIGRHIHVNRPTESTRKGGVERETDRAREVFTEYCAALEQAAGALPIGILIELHGHRRNEQLEVATTGLSADDAQACKDAYGRIARREAGLPELVIEPIDELQFTARHAKANGSLTARVCTRALHIEIPRISRENEAARARLRPALSEWLASCVNLLRPPA